MTLEPLLKQLVLEEQLILFTFSHWFITSNSLKDLTDYLKKTLRF
jgi:hypothetical protein